MREQKLTRPAARASLLVNCNGADFPRFTSFRRDCSWVTEDGRCPEKNTQNEQLLMSISFISKSQASTDQLHLQNINTRFLENQDINCKHTRAQ